MDPLSPVFNRHLAFALFQTGKEDLAVQALKNQIALDPGFAGAHEFLGIIYLKQGKLSDAILELDSASQLPAARGLRGFAYARVGRTNDAQQLLHELMALHRQGSGASVDIALIQHGLRNDPHALEWLERAAEERIWRLNELNEMPAWDDLRQHPRAQAILRRMNLVK
jgi:tetratricopeptide (TPR) repeat protein